MRVLKDFCENLLVPSFGTRGTNISLLTTYCLTVPFAPLFVKLASGRAATLSRALSHFTRHACAATRQKLAHPPAILTPVLAQKIGNKKPRRSGVGWVRMLAGYSAVPSNSSKASIISMQSGAYSSAPRILLIKSRRVCDAFLALPLRAIVQA